MDVNLKQKLGTLLTDARNEEGAEKKSDLLKRYNAEPYGDEVEGRSTFVDSSASDAVDAILPEIMDVFTSSESIVEFTPVGPEDEEAAKQETQVVEHIFWDKNNGFEILSVWLKEAMIQQNAYVWRGWIENDRVEIEEYEDLTFDEFMSVMQEFQDEDYKFLEKEGFDIIEDEETGEEVILPTAETISFKIRCVKRDKEYLIEPFPQEDFFITPRWSKVSLKGVPCCGRRHRDKTIEDWEAFGFSKDSLESLSDEAEDEETSSRHHTRDHDESEANDDSVTLYEVYAMLDAGDGPQLHRIWCNSDASTIMQWKNGKEAVEEVSDIPIHSLTPYIMPHRHTGRSVVENVDDIQRVKTVLMRQLLDSIYATLYARPHYNEDEAGEYLESDLTNPKAGSGVRTGGAEVTYPAAAAAAGIPATIGPVLEKFDNLQEVRTGATRYNQGLDAESLNKTASGISQIMNASQKKAKLVARTFAETGLMGLFIGIHRDLRSGPMKEIALKLRGQWASVNPRTWRHRTDMQVAVGMGRGDRDERRAGLMMAGQVQRELIAAGSVMVDEDKLFNSIDGVLQTFGIRNVTRFFNDPKTTPKPPPAKPRPDPIMISAAAQSQKMISDAQRDAAKLKADERDRERKHELEMAKLRLREVELMNKIEDQDQRLQLDKNKAVMEDDFKRDKVEIDALTAFQREEARTVQSEPPISHEEVTGSNP